MQSTPGKLFCKQLYDFLVYFTMETNYVLGSSLNHLTKSNGFMERKDKDLNNKLSYSFD